MHYAKESCTLTSSLARDAPHDAPRLTQFCLLLTTEIVSMTFVAINQICIGNGSQETPSRKTSRVPLNLEAQQIYLLFLQGVLILEVPNHGILQGIREPCLVKL